MVPGECERLGQVCLALFAGHRTPRVHLEHDHPGVAVGSEPLQQFRAWLAAAAGDEMIVGQSRPVAVGHVHMRQPGTELGGHLQGVGS